MKFFTSCVLLLLILLTGACNKKTSTALNPTTIDSLKSVFQELSSDLDASWSQMIKDDDEKLDNLRRVLQEVEYSGNYNRLKLDSLKKDIDQLEAARYDTETMYDSDLINRYDSMTNQVMGEVTVFTTRLEQFEQYPIMGQLLQEVFEADDRVLHHRIEYDRIAKRYNAFLESYQPDMQLLTRQQDIRPKPLFELQN